MNAEEFTLHLETTYNELTEQALVILKRMVTDKMDNDPRFKKLDVHSFTIGWGHYCFNYVNGHICIEVRDHKDELEDITDFIDNICKDLKLANHKLTFYRSSHYDNKD